MATQGLSAREGPQPRTDQGQRGSEVFRELLAHSLEASLCSQLSEGLTVLTALWMPHCAHSSLKASLCSQLSGGLTVLTAL
ncbi:hypothetical protein ACOMHN_011574 [Nucella lapillus]